MLCGCVPGIYALICHFNVTIVLPNGRMVLGLMDAKRRADGCLSDRLVETTNSFSVTHVC